MPLLLRGASQCRAFFSRSGSTSHDIPAQCLSSTSSARCFACFSRHCIPCSFNYPIDHNSRPHGGLVIGKRTAVSSRTASPTGGAFSRALTHQHRHSTLGSALKQAHEQASQESVKWSDDQSKTSRRGMSSTPNFGMYIGEIALVRFELLKPCACNYTLCANSYG